MHTSPKVYLEENLLPGRHVEGRWGLLPCGDGGDLRCEGWEELRKEIASRYELFKYSAFCDRI